MRVGGRCPPPFSPRPGVRVLCHQAITWSTPGQCCHTSSQIIPNSKPSTEHRPHFSKAIEKRRSLGKPLGVKAISGFALEDRDSSGSWYDGGKTGSDGYGGWGARGTTQETYAYR